MAVLDFSVSGQCCSFNGALSLCGMKLNYACITGNCAGVMGAVLCRELLSHPLRARDLGARTVAKCDEGVVSPAVRRARNDKTIRKSPIFGNSVCSSTARSLVWVCTPGARSSPVKPAAQFAKLVSASLAAVAAVTHAVRNSARPNACDDTAISGDHRSPRPLSQLSA